jgi:hypothetical protein
LNTGSCVFCWYRWVTKAIHWFSSFSFHLLTVAVVAGLYVTLRPRLPHDTFSSINDRYGLSNASAALMPGSKRVCFEIVDLARGWHVCVGTCKVPTLPERLTGGTKWKYVVSDGGLQHGNA